MSEPVARTDACHLDPGGEPMGCVTCGDVAVPLTVVDVEATGDARCTDTGGREELVAVDLVGHVGPGDRLLVHAKVAIERLATASTPPTHQGGELR